MNTQHEAERVVEETLFLVDSIWLSAAIPELTHLLAFRLLSDPLGVIYIAGTQAKGKGFSCRQMRERNPGPTLYVLGEDY